MRKTTLASLVARAGPGLRFNEHIEADGLDVFNHACRLGFEGIVSKQVKSPEIASCQLPFNILSSDAEPYRQNGSYCRASCRRRILTMMMTTMRRKTRRTANHLDKDE